jgi:hypothetical protein
MFNINIYCTAGVRKRDGTEYEPDTLTGIQNSIDRHLKNLKSKVDKKNIYKPAPSNCFSYNAVVSSASRDGSFYCPFPDF